MKRIFSDGLIYRGTIYLVIIEGLWSGERSFEANFYSLGIKTSSSQLYSSIIFVPERPKLASNKRPVTKPSKEVPGGVVHTGRLASEGIRYV